MRVVINIVVALVVAAFGYAAWLRYQSEEQHRAEIRQVRAAVQDLSREIKLHAALGKSELNGRGWPVTIDPVWFDSHPPQNVLLDDERPWLEVAPPEHAELLNPPVRIAVHRTVAAFWYNPANGVVRARAPMSLSDKRSTEVYNEINGVSLASIFADIMPAHPDSLAPAIAGESDDSASATPVEGAETAAVPDDAGEMTEHALDPTAPLLAPREEPAESTRPKP